MDDDQKTTETDVKPVHEKTRSKRSGMRITEKQRTFILILLLIFGIAFIYWSNHNYAINFTETLN